MANGQRGWNRQPGGGLSSDGRPARNADPFGTIREFGQRADQVLRVRVEWFVEQRAGVSFLHHLAGVQDQDAVGQVGVHTHVMRDQHERGVVCACGYLSAVG